MGLRTGTLSVFLLLMLSQGGRESAPIGEPYSDTEAYAVYAEVLPMIWNWELHEPESVVFQQETEFNASGTVKGLCIKGDKSFRQEWGSTLAAYVKTNEISRSLQPVFPTNKPYTLVHRKELSDLIGKSHWRDFYARYPEAKSYVSMSSVGFNPERTKALLTMTYHCGMLCMEGTYYLMEKKDGKWVRARLTNVTSCTWAS